MNSRFAVATHVLTLINEGRGDPVTSEYIAGSVNTNASLIRRLIAQLNKAGLTISRLGAGGGARLARPARDITLLDVYRAVDDEPELFPLHRDRPNPACAVGRNIQTALEHHFHVAARAMEAELDRVTIADLAADVTRAERRRGTARAGR
jgi:Rrf2 family protein